MIEERALVVALEGQYALVQTQRQSACGQCAANKGCGTAVLSKVIGQRYSRIRVVNSKNANIGDTVIIGLNENALLKSALLIYCVPLLAMLFAVFAGQWVFADNFTEGWAIVSGVAGLIVSFQAVKWFTARVSGEAAYQAVMVKVEPGGLVHQHSVFAP